MYSFCHHGMMTRSQLIWSVFQINTNFKKPFGLVVVALLRALQSVCWPKGSDLNLKAYEINVWIFWCQCIKVYPEFLRVFWTLDFQGMRAQWSFLFATLDLVNCYSHGLWHLFSWSVAQIIILWLWKLGMYISLFLDLSNIQSSKMIVFKVTGCISLLSTFM